jgi:DNA repair exonuclease SbcCD ATPase subunit
MDRREEVIIAFNKLVREEDCFVELDASERLILATSCIRLSNRITRDLFPHVFMPPHQLTFNSVIPEVQADLPEPGIGPTIAPQPEAENNGGGAEDSPHLSMAKFYFSLAVTPADIDGENYHGKALLVRVCMKVVDRLLQKFATKLSINKQKLYEDYASLEHVLNGVKRERDSLKRQLANRPPVDHEERAALVAQVQEAERLKEEAEGAAATALEEVHSVQQHLHEALKTMDEKDTEHDKVRVSLEKKLKESESEKADLGLKAASLDYEMHQLNEKVEITEKKLEDVLKSHAIEIKVLKEKLELAEKEKEKYHKFVVHLQDEEEKREANFIKAKKRIQAGSTHGSSKCE